MSVEYDYDLIIVGCGVGGHGAALVFFSSMFYNIVNELWI